MSKDREKFNEKYDNDEPILCLYKKKDKDLKNLLQYHGII